MAEIIRRLQIPRRTFLRSLGASLALPYLTAMEPALARGGRREPMSAVFIFSPNGMKMDDWTPPEEGALKSLPYLLQPLEKVKQHMQVLSGFALDGGRAHGDGPGDHARAAASFLTACHPVKTQGADIRAGISVDQELAKLRPAGLPFASLELGLEEGRFSGSCDSGYSCAYSNTISWRSPTTPNPKETRPKALFERLFGPLTGDPMAAEKKRRRRSILDTVAKDSKALLSRLGGEDRNRLSSYMEAVRSVEERLVALEADQGQTEPPQDLASRDRGDYGTRLDLMYEMVRLVLMTNQTQVITLMLGNAGSNRSYRSIGVPEGHHDLSHHGKKDHNLGQIRKINRFQMEAFGRFAESLASSPGPEGGLLQNTVVLLGSGLADGDRHNHEDLPILLLGNTNDRLRGGRHVRVRRDTPLANVYLELLRQSGSRATSFGDSKGECPEIRR
ncbi:MAG TPA: DUF1552 domain-containing protein [Planctomycetota bacterium]|nr:DUF1552 domain-containing protein [Planctomycetota bacterium]